MVPTNKKIFVPFQVITIYYQFNGRGAENQSTADSIYRQKIFYTNRTSQPIPRELLESGEAQPRSQYSIRSRCPERT